jgi:hypothetical protein
MPLRFLLTCTYSLEERVDGLFLSQEEKVVDLGQDKALACFCHVDVGFSRQPCWGESNLLKDFCQVFLPCFWTAP